MNQEREELVKRVRTTLTLTIFQIINTACMMTLYAVKPSVFGGIVVLVCAASSGACATFYQRTNKLLKQYDQWLEKIRRINDGT